MELAASRSPVQLQQGYRAVPLFPGEAGGALRLCLVVRDAASPVAGVFVLLRDTFDASIYLGALADAGGYVHDWLEVWVQNTSHLATQLETLSDTLTNRVLDDRWQRREDAFARLDRESLYLLPPPEGEAARPVFFDLAVTAPVESARAWALCRDDALLEKHGLPAYSTSLARYLRGAEERFLPVTEGAPENGSTRPLAETLGPLIPFNPGAGRMMVRRLAPLDFEAYLELMSGRPWSGLEQGEKAFRLDGLYRTLLDDQRLQQGHGFLRWSRPGTAERVLETFVLKLEILLQCFCLVRDFVQEEQAPFLNLTAESFRVRLAEASASLPFFWSAKVELARPGTAAPLNIPGPDAPCFASPVAGALSVWMPEIEMRVRRSTGSVRLSKVTFGEAGAVVIEGTLSSRESLVTQPSDLLSLRLTLASGRLDFFVQVTEESAPGEFRFQSLPAPVPEVLQPALRSAEGVSFTNVPLASLPRLSTPVDLYSLGVLGVRVLLVNGENTLAVALAEIFALGQSVGVGGESGQSLVERVGAIAEGDPRWTTSLGPNRLLAAPALPVAECFAHLPRELWWKTLSLLLTCFPGRVPEAACANFAQAPGKDPASAFYAPIALLELLVRDSRRLLFDDRAGNAELHELLRQAQNESA